jgi:hypothetical protein
LRVSEIWCLQPGNVRIVVRTAALDGLGTVEGKGSSFLPKGSEGRPLKAEEWRKQRPKEFARVCDKTYEALTGRLAEPDKESGKDSGDDDLSSGEEFVLTLGSGSVAALVGALGGAIGGYQVTKRTRSEERKYLRADLLAAALANLNAALEGLPEAYEERPVDPTEWEAPARCARELQTRLPGDSTAAAKAESSIETLLSLLGPTPSGGADKEHADDLRAARSRLNEDVGELVKEVNEDAGIAPWGDPPEKSSAGA